jgi:hypothetical protein
MLPRNTHQNRKMNKSLLAAFAIFATALSAHCEMPNESDIRSGVSEAQRTTDRVLGPRRQKLSPLINAATQIYANSNNRLKKSLSGINAKGMVVDDQPPGDSVVISSVNMDFNGFVAIEQTDVLGVSPLLLSGAHQNIKIPLDQHVDGTSLLAVIYKDNGDGVFDRGGDQYSNGTGRVVKEFEISTRRDRGNAYYSTSPMNGTGLIFIEQVPGNYVEYIDGCIPNGRPYYVAIFRDENGLPGRYIGHSALQRSSRINLTETVSDEMLFALMFEDNSGGQFDLARDQIARGKDGTIVIAKFKVIK